MSTRPRAVFGEGDGDAAAAASWGRVALVSGWVAGVGLVVQTGLFLVDASNVLADQAEFRRTGAGVEVDRAEYYVRYFERQHAVLWDISIRDTVGPVAFVALAIWALAVVFTLRPRGPVGPLMVFFFSVGSVLHVVDDLIYLSLERVWRFEGFSADPPGPMNSLGAAVDVVDISTTYLEAMSYLVLAGGAGSLVRLTWQAVRIPRWLAVAAAVESVALVLMGTGVGFQQDLLFQVGGGLAGVVLGPLVTIGVAHALRAVATAPATHFAGHA